MIPRHEASQVFSHRRAIAETEAHVLDETADEESVCADEPPFEARLVLVDPFNRLAGFRFDDRPMLCTDGERGKALRKLERNAHEWTRDEEADGDVKQVEETCAAESSNQSESHERPA